MPSARDLWENTCKASFLTVAHQENPEEHRSTAPLFVCATYIAGTATAPRFWTPGATQELRAAFCVGGCRSREWESWEGRPRARCSSVAGSLERCGRVLEPPSSAPAVGCPPWGQQQQRRTAEVQLCLPLPAPGEVIPRCLMSASSANSRALRKVGVQRVGLWNAMKIRPSYREANPALKITKHQQSAWLAV